MKPQRLLTIAIAMMMISSCSVEKIGTNLEKEAGYYSHTNFTLYPAKLILRNGDTIAGTFTTMNASFLLSHPVRDSNTRLEKANFYYLRYFRKWTFAEVRAYIVNNTRMEVMQPYNETRGSDERFKYDGWLVLQKVTPEGSPIDLYHYYLPYVSPREARHSTTRTSTGLWEDTTIGSHPYTLQYYLRIPGDADNMVWSLNTGRINDDLRLRLAALFETCTPLSEVREQLLANKEGKRFAFDNIFIPPLTGEKRQREAYLLWMIGTYRACREM